MPTLGEIFKMAHGGTEHIPADIKRMIPALRAIGYSFEQAVADLIDNSIDAGAKNIYIRFAIYQRGAFKVIISDDGKGMNEKKLKEAMRFGSKITKAEAELGKFGLGMKLASLSQCSSFTVATRSKTYEGARRWTVEGLANDYECDVFSLKQAKKFLRSNISNLELSQTGTVITWNELDRVKTNPNNVDQEINKIINRVRKHLGLFLHRFLSEEATRKVKMYIDCVNFEKSKHGPPRVVTPLNPFGYKRTGHPDYPCEFRIISVEGDELQFTAHVWPPKSNDVNYKLPGGANSAQGFYFYRNNRLIQAGGWCGLREIDPHYSLARVEFNLPPTADRYLSLEVKKVSVQLPPELLSKLELTKDNSGKRNFKKFMSEAEDVYRKKPDMTMASTPLIPGKGFSNEIVRGYHDIFSVEDQWKRKISFTWKSLDDDLFFDIDRDNNTVYLNTKYRKAVMHGLAESHNDAQLVKTLIFLLIKDILGLQRSSKANNKKLKKWSQMIALAARKERY